MASVQSYEQYLPYLKLLTNYDAFYGYVVQRSGSYNEAYSMGRIGSLIFAVDQLQNNVVNFFIGYGPGSISYQGYFSGISNDIFSLYGLKSLNIMMLGYLYEMGFIGIIILMYIFIKLYNNYKKVDPPANNVFLQTIHENFPITLILLFLSLFYVTTLKSHFLVIYFSLYFSYIKALSLNKNN